MKTPKKLNARGFAHHFALVLVVLVVAIGGTYYLVASHADTNCSGMSDPTSEPGNSGCPASSPVSPPITNAAITCTINGVPLHPSTGTVLTPSVTITNPSSSTVEVASLTASKQVETASGTVTIANNNISNVTLGAGQSASYKLGTYTITYQNPTKDTALGSVQFGVNANSPASGYCAATAYRPIQPLSCTITGVPIDVKKGSTFTTTVSFKNVWQESLSGSVSGKVLLESGTSLGPLKTVSFSSLSPGTTKKVSLGSFTVTSSIPNSTPAGYASVSVKTNGGWSGSNFSCISLFDN